MELDLLEIAAALLWAAVFVLVGIGAADLASWLGLGVAGRWLIGGVVAIALIAASEWINTKHEDAIAADEELGEQRWK